MHESDSHPSQRIWVSKRPFFSNTQEPSKDHAGVIQLPAGTKSGDSMRYMRRSMLQDDPDATDLLAAASSKAAAAAVEEEEEAEEEEKKKKEAPESFSVVGQRLTSAITRKVILPVLMTHTSRSILFPFRTLTVVCANGLFSTCT